MPKSLALALPFPVDVLMLADFCACAVSEGVPADIPGNLFGAREKGDGLDEKRMRRLEVERSEVRINFLGWLKSRIRKEKTWERKGQRSG
jgi:hypothetical protein